MAQHNYAVKKEILLARGKPRWAVDIGIAHDDECSLLSVPWNGACDCDPDVYWTKGRPQETLFTSVDVIK